MLPMMGKKFAQLVKIGEAIKDGLKTRKIVRAYRRSCNIKYRLPHKSILQLSIQNHEKGEEEATLRNMTDIVSAHTKSLQRLDCHMNCIFDQDEQSIIDFHDAFENNEQDSSTYSHERVTDDTSIKEANEEPKVEASIPLSKLPIPPPPFPQQTKKKHGDEKMAKYLDMLKQVTLSISFIEAFKEM
ncbi:hypothetical protein HAX54_031999 [Datura stramonium]|uniref:Uncharacterized protein n=1 Tax=Datura stramonium TaxID=4076 RepID=A0ABS8VBB5_DATST|nr:hypothetical protein [Datura stramonium]